MCVCVCVCVFVYVCVLVCVCFTVCVRESEEGREREREGGNLHTCVRVLIYIWPLFGSPLNRSILHLCSRLTNLSACH